MARVSAENLDVKILKAEEKVMRLGDQYNAACCLRALFFAITFYLHTGEGACRKRSYSPSGSTGYVIWKFRNTWDRIKKQKLLEQPLSIAFLGEKWVL